MSSQGFSVETLQPSHSQFHKLTPVIAGTGAPSIRVCRKQLDVQVDDFLVPSSAGAGEKVEKHSGVRLAIGMIHMCGWSLYAAVVVRVHYVAGGLWAISNLGVGLNATHPLCNHAHRSLRKVINWERLGWTI